MQIYVLCICTDKSEREEERKKNSQFTNFNLQISREYFSNTCLSTLYFIRYEFNEM